MTKKQVENQEDEMDFMSLFEEEGYSEDMMVDVMRDTIAACNNQMQIAVELTKLIIEGSITENREEQVFSVFKKAVSVVSESFPLKNIMS
ncbi:hypothetical protein J2N86_04580 [Legionella lytica]|uniref:Uncharacterized protein n=1 Tax=Legionella lytica TaxID=96232 RepID=A0ABY4YAC5_9GAMM|nr:hypothetical protein [Legionella lytica]USQ14592.1 hypothetical protein J2N86_04580 [Legionella lytica]